MIWLKYLFRLPLVICTVYMASQVSSHSVPILSTFCSLQHYIKFNVKANNPSVRWNQANMIKQFASYLIIRGMICGLHRPSGSSHCGRLCMPLAYSKMRIWQQSYTVRQQCQKPMCNASARTQSRVPPCGTISYSSNLDGRSQWKLTHPAYLEFNFTIWRVMSRRYPLRKAKCKYVPSLALWNLDSFSGNSLLQSRMCGHTPIQNIISSAQTVRVEWNRGVLYRESTDFCLSYQPIAIGYARQHAPFYPRMSLLKYFKDEIINRQFILDTPNHLNGQIFEVYGFFTRSINSNNLQFRYFRGGVLQRIWSVTGSVYYVPQFTLRSFLCAADNSSSSKRSTLEVFDHPLAYYDPIWQMHPYIIGSIIKCPTTGPSFLYNSSIGDLTIQLTTTLTHDVKMSGRVEYNALSCPGSYCIKTVQNVSASKGNRFSMTSHAESTQQRHLIAKFANETGFIAVSNFTVRVNGPTHAPCYYGGLFIYELEPLTLVAKICTPWVARAWHNAVKRADGTSGLPFNTRPVLFVIKSYGEKFYVHVDGYATITSCAGVVNAAFRDMLWSLDIRNRGGITFRPQNTLRIKHTNGCLQLSHILTDDEYLTQEQKQLEMFADSDSSTVLALHTVEVSLKDIIGISAYHKLMNLFDVNGIPYKNLPCKMQGIDIDLPDSPNFNTSNVVSLMPGRRSYSIRFSSQCLVFGINPVVVMEYTPAEMHSCPRQENLKRHIRMFDELLDEIKVSFPSFICGDFQIADSAFYRTPQTFLTSRILLVFTKPSLTGDCCVFDLDLYFSTGHLHTFGSIVIKEHDLDEYSWHDVVFTRDQFMLYSNRGIQRAVIFWTCSSNIFCSIVDNYSKLPENSSMNVRAIGRSWNVNTMHSDYASLQLINWHGDDVLHFIPRMKITFRFIAWKSAATPPVTNGSTADGIKRKVAPNWKHRYSYCFTAYGICYDFYETNVSSWFDGEQFCRSHGKVLLSTPTNYEWEIVAALFAKEPAIVNLAKYNSLAFINLLKIKVCCLGRVFFSRMYFCGLFSHTISTSLQISRFSLFFSTN